MARLQFIVEGQTEEAFVNKVLREQLAVRGVYTAARCIETSRSPERIHRGGITTYAWLKRDLLRWMKQDRQPDAYFTTMVDLYMLPADFPGYQEAARIPDPFARVSRLEASIQEDLQHPRFIPYIQLHEFEALIFAEPAKLSISFPGREMEISSLQSLSSNYESPELIDDSETTAPSKRIISCIPEYQGRKPAVGPVVAQAIGLEMLRARCRHFSDWLVKLEQLGVRQYTK